MLHRSAENGGFVVAYGHPHSVRSGNSQDFRHLEPFLERAAELKRKGRLDISRPCDVVSEAAA